MLRNREVQWLLVFSIVIVGLGSLIAGQISLQSAIVLLATVAFLAMGYGVFTYWRYQKIRQLSIMLDEICNGKFDLDVRNNMEGELSLLRSNIYKITSMLTKQGRQLKKDKLQLADGLSDISHQLRTPLTSMMVMTELLQQEDLAKEQRELFLQTITQQLERIQWLVTSLLKISQIDAGTITFKEEIISVAAVVKKAVEPFLILMELKEQQLVIKGDETATFYGDLSWSSEALTNIIKNCAEHTPAGGIIKIDYQQNPIYTEIIISDNGEGIDQDDLPYIFQRFYRGKNATSDSVGIGLAMSRAIVLAQHGDIVVESSPKGSRFCVKFYHQVV